MVKNAFALSRLLVRNSMQQRNFLYLRQLRSQIDVQISNSYSLSLSLRSYCTSNNCGDKNGQKNKPERFLLKKIRSKCDKYAPPYIGIIAKFKYMYKEYGIIYIPIHVITSIAWFTVFLYLSKSGVDGPTVLHYVPLDEDTKGTIQGPEMGHYAFSYLCYKAITPIRYAMTLSCTTRFIKYLMRHGWIKPNAPKSDVNELTEEIEATSDSSKEDKTEKRKGRKAI